MAKLHRFFGIAICLAVTLTGTIAHADDHQSELVYIVPMIGAEYVGIASAALQSDYMGVDTSRSSSVGLAYGGHAGFVFGPFRLGALFQQTRLFQSDGLNFNKLYLEAGLGGRRGIVGLSVTLAGGWAFFASRSIALRNGGGARLSFAADIYLNRYFSLGPEISVDVAGYAGAQTVYASWGVTGALRAGLHL